MFDLIDWVAWDDVIIYGVPIRSDSIIIMRILRRIPNPLLYIHESDITFSMCKFVISRDKYKYPISIKRVSAKILRRFTPDMLKIVVASDPDNLKYIKRYVPTVSVERRL